MRLPGPWLISERIQSMKMIASTRLAKAQRALQSGKQYGIANAGVWIGMLNESVFKLIYVPEMPELFANTKPEEVGKRKLFVVLSSDKGLCGGIHSSVSKATRAAIKDVDPESSIMIVGDKSKAQLSRALPKNLALTFNQIGRDIPTFADAAAVADLIFKSGVKYDSIVIVYNKFVSALSFEADSIEVQTEASLREAREWIPVGPIFGD